MRIILVRHGQSIANAEGRLQGQKEYPLSSQGKEEAKKVAEWLEHQPIDAIYSSDLSRAYETAKEIAAYHSMEVQKDVELREMNLGRFQGLTRHEIEERYPDLAPLDWQSIGLEDVESIEALYARTLRVLDKLMKTHWGEQIVVVSHGGFIGTTLMALLEMKWKGKRAFAIGNTSLTTIDFNDPKQFVIVGINESPHLAYTIRENASAKIG